MLTKARIRSEEWKIVIEHLDRVNVFIFPMLKFKKWNSSWAPGCTLSCLNRSYYLLRVCLGELLGESNLKLITKNQIVSFSFNGLLSYNERYVCCHGVWRSVALCGDTNSTKNSEKEKKTLGSYFWNSFYLDLDPLTQL